MESVNTQPENQENKPLETEYYDISECDYITAAYNALAAFDGLDVYDADMIAKKERTVIRCFAIIDKCIESLYNSLMDEEEE